MQQAEDLEASLFADFRFVIQYVTTTLPPPPCSPLAEVRLGDREGDNLDGLPSAFKHEQGYPQQGSIASVSARRHPLVVPATPSAFGHTTRADPRTSRSLNRRR